MDFKCLNDKAKLENVSHLVRCIDVAIEKKVDILNFSFSGYIPHHGPTSNAISRAARAGVMIVTAAGNDGRNNDNAPHPYPSFYKYVHKNDSGQGVHENMLVVAASESNSDGLANFSSSSFLDHIFESIPLSNYKPKILSSNYGPETVDYFFSVLASSSLVASGSSEVSAPVTLVTKSSA